MATEIQMRTDQKNKIERPATQSFLKDNHWDNASKRIDEKGNKEEEIF